MTEEEERNYHAANIRKINAEAAQAEAEARLLNAQATKEEERS